MKGLILNEKITKGLLLAMVCASLALAIAIFTYQPAIAAPMGPAVECESCTYLGFRVDCTDSHCTGDPIYKHGVYFHYTCYDRCTGQYSDEWIFQYCHNIC